MRKLLPFLLLFTLSTAFSQSFKVIGYLPYYRFSWLNDIEFERLTHINIAFANPDANGNLSVEGTNIAPVISKAHQAGCEVFISLAGGYLTPCVRHYDLGNRAGCIWQQPTIFAAARH